MNGIQLIQAPGAPRTRDDERLASLRRRAARRARGVTLFEVLIVVAILAMVAGGVAVFALPAWNKAQLKTATSWAHTIQGAAEQWKAENADCPTVSQLVEDKILKKGTSLNDPWGSPYEITCDGEDITVSSPGPNKKKGDEDDVRVPEVAGEVEEP